MLEIYNEHYKEELSLFQTILGIKKQSAMQIISETGGDKQSFESSSKMVGWAGLRPTNDESPGKVKNTKITKSNPISNVYLSKHRGAHLAPRELPLKLSSSNYLKGSVVRKLW